MIPTRLATFVSYSSRNFIAAAIRGSIVGAAVSVLPVLYLYGIFRRTSCTDYFGQPQCGDISLLSIFYYIPGIFIGCILFSAMCMLLGAAWGCLRVADRYDRAFPLFIIRYAIFGAVVANVAVNLFSAVSSGRIPNRLLFDELTTARISQEDYEKLNDETRATIEAPDDWPSDFLRFVWGDRANYVQESWFSHLFMRFNELAIYMGALFGALVRTLMYFRNRNAERHTRLNHSNPSLSISTPPSPWSPQNCGDGR